MNELFKIPKGEFTENEQKALAAIAGEINKCFDEFSKGVITKEQLSESIAEKMSESGMTSDKIKKIENAIKEQEDTLNKLKSNVSAGGFGMSGLKAAFDKNYDGLVNAIKAEKDGFIIKAVDEHTAASILTTGNALTTTTGADLTEGAEDPNLYLKRRDRQYIHDIASVSYVEKVPETYSFWEEGDETGAIAVVGENGLKPQVKLGLIKNKVDAQKAAGYIVVTEEVMKWRTRAWAAIQRLFSDKVYRDYENLLTTQVVGDFATGYIGTPLDGTIPANQVTDFTALVASVLQLETLNFVPDTLIINPADKWRLALTQANNGTFILPYITQGGAFNPLGLNVITTNKVATGTFLLGESGIWKIEEEAPQLRTGTVNDDLIHNRMTIVGEIFFLSYVPSNNRGGWINGNFDDIKEALTATE